MKDVEIRRLAEADSLQDLTDLLHRAYASLGAMGFRYRAVDQDVETTKTRLSKGECFVVVHQGLVVGTALLSPPSLRAPWCEWYDRLDVSVLSQLAVEPRFQGRGWGSALVRHIEGRAAELRAAELSVDTSQGATHLIEFYGARGYRNVGYAQWTHTNYRSVLLSKRLSGVAG
jgi:GNAT superfamily N-acetyltransferase